VDKKRKIGTQGYCMGGPLVVRTAAAFPERISTPELNIPISEDYKFEVVQRLVEQASSISDATVNTIDGLRVEWPYGWGLVRASNTGPYLVARFEANDDDALDRVKYSFKELLGQVDPMLLLPFCPPSAIIST